MPHLFADFGQIVTPMPERGPSPRVGLGRQQRHDKLSQASDVAMVLKFILGRKGVRLLEGTPARDNWAIFPGKKECPHEIRLNVFIQ